MKTRDVVFRSLDYSKRELSLTLFRSTVLRTNAVSCTAQIYPRKAANSKIFPRNSEPIRNNLPSLFCFYPLQTPPDQENTLKHQPTHSFCFCCRRAAWNTLEEYVLVKRLILPTSLMDTQTVWHNNNKQDFVHTIQLSCNLAQNAIQGREKVNVMKLIKMSHSNNTEADL